MEHYKYSIRSLENRAKQKKKKKPNEGWKKETQNRALHFDTMSEIENCLTQNLSNR